MQVFAASGNDVVTMAPTRDVKEGAPTMKPMTHMIDIASARLPAAFDGFRIAHISDLHNTSFGARNENLLRAIRSARPDIVAVTGDLVDSRHTDYDIALAFATEAARIAPVCYVMGNHETRLARRAREARAVAAYARERGLAAPKPDFDFGDFERALDAIGIHVLHDRAIRLRRDNAHLRVIGLDDPRHPGPSGALPHHPDPSHLVAQDPETYTIILAHRPELFSSYVQAGADLALSGHAHGGQIRLPFIGGLYAPGQGILPRYDAGPYRSGRTVMVVSRGMGNMAPIPRVNNDPELVVVRLHRA